MDFLPRQESDMYISSPMSRRNQLSRDEIERQRLKADKVTWFTHNEFLWRSGASFLWFIFLLPPISMLYLALVLFSANHPIAWISDVLSKIFSLWEIFIFFLMFEIIIAPVVLLNVKICSVEVRSGVSRLGVIRSFFTAKHLSHLMFCMLSGSLGIHWLSVFTYHEYAEFTHNCSVPVRLDRNSTVNTDLSVTTSHDADEIYSRYKFRLFRPHSEELCFNETTLFLYVYAGILGMFYSVQYFKEKHHQIKFPVIQQERIFRVKACLVPSFWHAATISFKSVQIGYPFYFFFGYFAKEAVRALTGLRQNRYSRWDSLYVLLDIRLFWFCFITGMMLTYVWLLANKVFVIFYTEVFRFPIQTNFSENANQSLLVALKCQNVPLLKYLAMNDLCQLSQFSAKRRKEIFSLSIPGGRPLNWLWISDECLTLLNDLKERLMFHNEHHHVACAGNKLTDSFLKTTSRSFKESSQSSVKRTPSSLRSTSEVTTAGSKSFRHILSGHHSSERTLFKTTTVVPDKKKVLISKRIKQSPLVEYFIEKVDELEMEDLFCDVQLQIWAAEGLSRLVMASFTEDVFGVVQKTLPFIVGTLLELLQAVETYLKKPIGHQNLYRRQQPSETRKTVHVLRDSLRCSIYRITKTFQKHISDIELTASNKEFLVSFLSFNE